MDARGGNVRRLTFEGGYNDQAAWSPQGDRIAYAGWVDDHFDIFVMDVATGAAKRLTGGAGYNEMLARVGNVKRYCFEEEPQVEIPLTHKERLRDYIFTPEPIARADFFVNCPKFKSHPWTTVTFAPFKSVPTPPRN